MLSVGAMYYFIFGTYLMSKAVEFCILQVERTFSTEGMSNLLNANRKSPERAYRVVPLYRHVRPLIRRSGYVALSLFSWVWRELEMVTPRYGVSTDTDCCINKFLTTDQYYYAISGTNWQLKSSTLEGTCPELWLSIKFYIFLINSM